MAINNPQSYGFPIAFGQVVNPVNSSSPIGSTQALALGKSGELLVGMGHGKFFQATRNGNVYTANASGATGVIPVAPGGTTSGFMFYNPVGSGIVMEIIKIRTLPLLAATDVVAVLGVEVGTPPSAVGTALTPAPLLLNGQNVNPLGKASTGSTIVAMTYAFNLDVAINTTGGLAYDGDWEQFLDGTLVLLPGGAAHIVSSTVQTHAFLQDVTWSEWPL